MHIYKVFLAQEWADFQTTTRFTGSPDDHRDGFIHFSTAAQLPETLRKYYTDRGPVIIARAHNESWGTALKWETSRGGDLFPHLYGVLHLADITAHWDLREQPGHGYDMGAIKGHL